MFPPLATGIDDDPIGTVVESHAASRLGNANHLDCCAEDDGQLFDNPRWPRLLKINIAGSRNFRREV